MEPTVSHSVTFPVSSPLSTTRFISLFPSSVPVQLFLLSRCNSLSFSPAWRSPSLAPPSRKVLTPAILIIRLIDYSNIIKGLVNSGRSGDFFKNINSDVLSGLEDDEQKAGGFVCNILSGDVPDALVGIGEDVVSEASEDFAVVTSFIVCSPSTHYDDLRMADSVVQGGLPTLVPEVFSAIEQDGEDAISVVEELFTNPGAALTVIVNGAESVIDDIGSDIGVAAGDIATFFECLFGCPAPMNLTTTAPASLSGVGGTLQSMCASVKKNQVAMTTTQSIGQLSPTAVPGPTASSNVQSTSQAQVQSTPSTLASSPASSAGSASTPAASQTGHGEREQSQALWIWAGSLACTFAVMVLL